MVTQFGVEAVTHKLRLDLGNSDDMIWAQRIVTQYHYLRQPVDPRARPMVYIVRHDDDTLQRPLGLIMLGIPHATRCRRWWGYPGLRGADERGKSTAQ